MAEVSYYFLAKLSSVFGNLCHSPGTLLVSSVSKVLCLWPSQPTIISLVFSPEFFPKKDALIAKDEPSNQRSEGVFSPDTSSLAYPEDEANQLLFLDLIYLGLAAS